MKTEFEVCLDQKVEVWTRQTFYVTAENKDEALKLAKVKSENDGPDNFEYLIESETVLSPEENEGQYTEEWLIDEEQVETNIPEKVNKED